MGASGEVGQCCKEAEAGQNFSGGFCGLQDLMKKAQALGTEFTMKIFCLKLTFKNTLLTHYLPEIVFVLKGFFDSSSLIARQQLGSRTARGAGSTTLPSFLTQTLPSATAVATSFQPRGACTEVIGEAILICIFNSLKCLEACKKHYINQLITVSEVSQPIRIQFSLMRDK